MSDGLPVPAVPPDLAAAIVVLARRYRRANGPVMGLLTRLGGSLERQLEALPRAVRDRIGPLTEAALTRSWAVAGLPGLRGTGRRGSLAAAVAAGAAGGAGGLATAVAELPVTVTLILQAIRAEAEAAGLEPADPQVRALCLQVFAAGSPLAGDDGIDTSFLSARLTLTGPALHKLISTVAPRLATALTQKLAAQAVPVLGAAAGAGLNAAFLHYYREVAAIRFALVRLAEVHGEQPVLDAFRLATTPAPVVRAQER